MNIKLNGKAMGLGIVPGSLRLIFLIVLDFLKNIKLKRELSRNKKRLPMYIKQVKKHQMRKKIMLKRIMRIRKNKIIKLI
jgi:hypothetical protein